MHTDRTLDARKARQPWSDKLLKRPQSGGGKWIILGGLLASAVLIGLTVVMLLALQDQQEESARAQSTQNMRQLDRGLRSYATPDDFDDAQIPGYLSDPLGPPTRPVPAGPGFNPPRFNPGINDGVPFDPPPQVPTGWGNLKGRFVVAGELPDLPPLKIKEDNDFVRQSGVRNEAIVAGPAGELANVVVYLTIRPPVVHPDLVGLPRPEQTLQIENCRFSPRIIPVRMGQTLTVDNRDPIEHHAQVYGARLGSTPADGAGDKRQVFRFAERTEVPALIESEEHPWMRGWVLVRDNPYMAVTSKEGAFEIKNLPAGVELQFEAWHEIPGSVDGGFTCLIQPDQTRDLGTIRVPAERLRPVRGSAARK